jgi:hypothetical protein
LEIASPVFQKKMVQAAGKRFDYTYEVYFFPCFSKKLKINGAGCGQAF